MTAPALQSTQDQSEFLPGHYESVKALTVQQEAFPERGEIGAIVVFDREDGSRLTEDDQAKVSSIAEQLDTKSYDNLGTAVAAPVSDNGLVQAIFVQVKPGKNAFDPAAIEDARNLRADLAPLVERDRPPLGRDRARRPSRWTPRSRPSRRSSSSAS